MKQQLFMEKYPLFVLEITKEESLHRDIDQIIKDLKQKIDNHPVAIYIATFDHYAHTISLPDHIIEPKIKGAKNLIFCFGKQLPKPEVVGVRPRSIGICEYEEKFVISFLEAPNQEAHAIMERWVKELKRP